MIQEMAMKQKILSVVSNVRLTDDVYRMVLADNDKTTDEPIISAPGQFINIKLDGYFLRRPISVADWDNDERTVTIIYKVAGDGTEYMKSLEAGKNLDVLLPLGNGFDISKSGINPVLIGGGAGLPPMYGTAKALIREGIKPSVIAGFNDESQVFLVKELEELGAEVHVTTVDGSMGTKGLVTDQLIKMNYSHIFTCGPEPMLRAIDKAMPEFMTGQFSFEERMGCGFGACMGCSCKTKYGSKRICKEGPVLERSEIIW